MQIILISGIPGTGLDDCVTAMMYEASSRKPPMKLAGPFRVEDKFVSAAKEDLGKYVQVIDRDYNFHDCLRLPFREFVKNAQAAFSQTVTAIENKGCDIAFITLHPVYFHQVTREFMAPHNPSVIASELNNNKHGAKFVVSIHDDIFDIHLQLMKPGQMFCPLITYDSDRKRKRNSEHDLYEQLLLLSWRDRELTAARSLAEQLKIKHFLFHKKGRVKTLVDVLCDGKKCVYFSHPISQPRRDINNIPDREKCPEPNKARGEQLLKECQEVANVLGKFAAVIEPTAIDEYRIDFQKLSDITEQKHLKSAILPPFSWRWPIGKDDRLAKQLIELNADGLYTTEVEFLGDVNNPDKYGTQPLTELQTACKMLAKEIRRQITVRDSILAGQADLIFAYRPFSLPNSPEPTGGVEKEVEIVRLRTKAHETPTKPTIVIFHPEEDEIRRRTNLFRQLWEKHSHRLRFGSDELKTQVFEEVIGALKSLIAIDSAAKLSSKLRSVFQSKGVMALPIEDESTMGEESMTLSDRAMDQVISLFYKSEIVESRLKVKEITSSGLIEMKSDCGNLLELGNYTRRILEGENK